MKEDLRSLVVIVIVTSIFILSVFSFHSINAQMGFVSISLDKEVYSWTDIVHINITAKAFNTDDNKIDEIGHTASNPITISTKSHSLKQYKLTETGPNTGIFEGEVILTGFEFDPYGDGKVATDPKTGGNGPNKGFLEADRDDAVTVSFKFSEDETAVESALIRWHEGEIQWTSVNWDNSIIPNKGTAGIRVVDPDMNLKPKSLDHLYEVYVWSDTDPVGIDIVLGETLPGVWEGAVQLTTVKESSGSRLRVSDGDTIIAEYRDHTPPPNHSINDILKFKIMMVLGSTVKPIEVPVSDGIDIYTVNFDTTSQISSPSFDSGKKELTFTISGPTGTEGKLTATIPGILLDDIFSVELNGQKLEEKKEWDNKRENGINYVTIKYTHSDHPASIRGHSTGVNSDLTTPSGYIVKHNWYPSKITPDKNLQLIVEIRDKNRQVPTSSASFLVNISKLGNPVFAEPGQTDPLTGYVNVLKNILKKPTEDDEIYDMEIEVNDFDGIPVNESVKIIPVVVVPEFSAWSISIVLVGMLILVILITKLKMYTKQLHMGSCHSIFVVFCQKNPL